MGPEPGDAASRVPAHRDWRRGSPVGGDGRGARVGEHRRELVRLVLEHEAIHRPGQRRGLARPSRVGQQRPDDVLLLRRRARGPTRIRPGRASRTTTLRPARVRRRGRNGSGDRTLPRLQRRAPICARLGNRHVDRHRICARAARPGRPAFLGASARIHAHGGRRGRPRRPRHHRDRLHGDPPRRAASRRGGFLRCRAGRASLSDETGAHLFRPRSVCLGEPPQVRSGAGRHRRCNGTSGLRVPGAAVEPRAGDRALPRVPRTTDSGACASRRRRAEVGDVGQRAAAADVSPLDELRHRPALCARERRHRDRRQLLGPGPHVADHTRDLLRLRGREAARHPRFVLARHPVEPRTRAAACRLGSGRRGRHDRRDRLHGRAPRLHTRLRREASSRKRSSES